MALPPRDFSRIGPSEGERFPDLRLPDQKGETVDLHRARGRRRALVVFYRSADWWPFCKTQLVQLQGVRSMLEAEGVALFAVSYDPVATLGAFADAHAITFPLLSDDGSHAMRRLGLLNERVAEDHAVYGIPANPRHTGLPYPGTFVLDEAGVIVQKRFHESYRVRDTGAGLVARTLGMLEQRSDVGRDGGAEPVRLHAWVDSPTYVWYQRLHLHVEIATGAGWHVYGRPAVDGMVPLTVEVGPIDGMEIGAIEWPAPHALRLAGIDKTVWVYDGRLRLTLPLTFTGPPGAGDHRIALMVGYQACSESSCLAPARTLIEIGLSEAPLVGRSLPPRAV